MNQPSNLSQLYPPRRVPRRGTLLRYTLEVWATVGDTTQPFLQKVYKGDRDLWKPGVSMNVSKMVRQYGLPLLKKKGRALMWKLREDVIREMNADNRLPIVRKVRP